MRSSAALSTSREPTLARRVRGESIEGEIVDIVVNGRLLYGFITREEVEMALSDQAPGTFLLRFSERHSGQIGIAYVGNHVNQIKHYLVQPTGMSHDSNSPPNQL